MTPYLTTVRAGTHGNSGFKSVKKYLIPNRKRRKALQITIKNSVQAFGSTITPITADLFGSKHVTENYGVMYLAFGFAGLVGPQLAVNFSSGGDYTTAYLVAAVISAIALVMALLVRKKVLSSYTD